MGLQMLLSFLMEDTYKKFQTPAIQQVRESYPRCSLGGLLLNDNGRNS